MKTENETRLCEDELAFDIWTKSLCVPKRPAVFSSLAEEFISLTSIRQKAKKYEFVEYLPASIQREMRQKYKLNDSLRDRNILAISVSDSSVRRACIFMDYIIDKMKELGAIVKVEQYGERADNTIITWKSITLRCSLTEQKIKRRYIDTATNGDMTPPYAEIPTGELLFCFYDEGRKYMHTFTDQAGNRLEKQIKDIFAEFRTYVLQQQQLRKEEYEESLRKYEARIKEEKAQQAKKDAEEKKKKELEKQLTDKQTISNHLSYWEQVCHVQNYIGDLTNYMVNLSDTQKNIIADYCEIVRSVYSPESLLRDILEFMSPRSDDL